MKTSLVKVLSILLTLIIIASLSACGGSQSNVTTAGSTGSTAAATTKAAETTAAPKEPVKLILAMYSTWDKPGIQALIKMVNDNPQEYGATIEVDKLPDTDQGKQLIKTRYAINEIPDLHYFHSAKNAFVEFGKETKYADITGDWTSMYDEETIKSPFFSVDGKVVATPMGGINIGAMFYNKKVFAELNLNIPNTWDEFLAVCEKIKAAGKTPVYISGKEDWTVQLWPMLGFMREFKAAGSSSMMDQLNTNKDKYATKQLFIEANKRQLDLKAKGYFNQSMMSETYANAQKALVDGTAAMYCMGSWVIDEILAAYPDKVGDLGAFAIPFDGNDALPAWMPWVMMAPEAGKNSDIARNIVMKWASKECQQAYFNAQAGIPLAKGLDMSTIKLTEAQKEAYAIYTSPGRGFIEFGNLAAYGQGDNFAKNNQELLIGSKTPEQVAAGIDADIEKTAKANKDPNWQ